MIIASLFENQPTRGFISMYVHTADKLSGTKKLLHCIEPVCYIHLGYRIQCTETAGKLSNVLASKGLETR